MNNDVLDSIYHKRFSGLESKRVRVWQVLTRHFFQNWIPPQAAVLDVGAGYCEFINQIQACKKYAFDANLMTRQKAGPDVTVISQDVCQPWNLPSAFMDVVFSSNFFEHLPSKDDLRHCLNEIHRVLRPGGCLLAMGPNIRFCSDVYWDFFDHSLPLSDRSMREVLQLSGFHVERTFAQFLPFTMTGSFPAPPLLVRLYLAAPFLWWTIGKQFLVIARKD